MGIRKDQLEPQVIPGMYEGRLVEHGGMFVAFETIEEGDPTPLFRGLPDDRCQSPHWGFLLKGKWLIKYADRDEEINAGEAYYIAPGHIPVVLEGSESIEFSPKEEYERTLAQIQKNLEAAGA